MPWDFPLKKKVTFESGSVGRECVWEFGLAPAPEALDVLCVPRLGTFLTVADFLQYVGGTEEPSEGCRKGL